MKRLFSFLLIVLMLLPTVGIFGCAEEQTEKTVLRVCNCEDYIDEDLLDEFEAEYPNIEVVYSTYGTNENLYNELVINPNSYDLVVPSEYMIEKLAVEGRIQKLDFAKIANYEDNISPFIKDRLKGITLKNGSLYDYMVGYMWGTMGWVYNTETVSVDDVKNWHSPFENPKLAKKITIKDAVRDSYLVGLAMTYEDELYQNAGNNEKITEILNRTDKKAIDEVGTMLTSLKPMLYGFEVDSGKNDIILGRIDAYVAWSGDAAYAIDVAAGEYEEEQVETLRALSYYVPEEGSNIWFDGFVMPSGSKNHDAVYKFLEFITRPETVYRNMDYTGYTSMIANGEFELEDEDGNTYQTTIFDEFIASYDVGVGNGEFVNFDYFFGGSGYDIYVSEDDFGRLIAQYPTADIVERCAVMSYFDGESLMAINEMWEGVKGETFPVWLIIVFAAFIVLLAIFIILYRNKEKIKWFKLPERKTTYAERKGLKVIKREEIKN